jgi:predicted regulator of Ras-like GTPase activity (Roadblock/LC7/MglB family)
MRCPPCLFSSYPIGGSWGGVHIVTPSVDISVGLFASLGPEDPILAAILLKRTGVTVASWVHDEAPRDILQVMAATLIGSIDTIAGTLGVPAPKAILVDAEQLRMLITPADPTSLLVLIGTHETSEMRLRKIAHSILTRAGSRAQVRASTERLLAPRA